MTPLLWATESGPPNVVDGHVAHCGIVFFHPWDLHPVPVSYLEIWDSLASMGVLSPFLGLSFSYCTPHSLPPGWPWDDSAGEACLSPAAMMARTRGHYTWGRYTGDAVLGTLW